MKHLCTKIILAMLMSMMGNQAFAHDIAVRNADGITIYYLWNQDKTELTVSYRGSNYSSYSNEYSGNVTIPESVVYEGKPYRVTSIGSDAFRNCYGLTSVTIPNSVTSIGDLAFYGCSGLTSVTIPNSVTSIGGGAFEYCSGLTSVTIPNSVTSIGESAFLGCRGLTYVTIPNSVTSIGNYSFNGCSGLTYVTIPNSVTSIGESAFSGCSGLTYVTIPNSVTSIGGYAFNGCSGLTSVTIPNSVTSIGNYSFNGCSGLTSVVIGSGVTSIGYDSFSGTNLKKTIWLTNTPPNGASYASGAMNYVSNNQFSFNNQVVYPFLSSYFDVEGIRYVPVSPSERTCDAIDCVYNETAAHTNIPSTVTFNGIALSVQKMQPYTCYENKFIESLNCNISTEIPNYAFTNCSNMKSMTLGNKITSIGKYAFSNCSNLPSAKIPDGVTTLNDHSFENCTALENVTIGSNVSQIKDYSFSKCISLPQITIPKAVKTIGNYVFSGCKGIKELIIEDREEVLTLGSNGSSPLFADCPLDNVYIGGDINYNTSKNYGYSPFYRNNSLRTVVITDKETEISANEFYGCTNLQSFTVGDGVTTFGDWAFSGCQSLKSLSFGTQLKTIGKEAFSDCTAVTEIVSKTATPPACGNQALDDINKWQCKLFVPTGTLTAYQSADQWKDFFFVEEGTGSGDTPDDPTHKVFDVGDLTSLLNYIMQRPGSAFNPQYDLNSDGELNIGDVILMISEIHKSNASRATGAKARTANSLPTEVDLSQFTAAQMIVSTDEQESIISVRLKGTNQTTHRLSCEPIGRGKYSVVVYSQKNQPFAADEDRLIELVRADGSVCGEFTTTNVVLASSEGKRIWLDSLPAGGTTDINVQSIMDNAQSDNWYNLSGQRISADQLHKGIYIKNGKKTVVR